MKIYCSIALEYKWQKTFWGFGMWLKLFNEKSDISKYTNKFISFCLKLREQEEFISCKTCVKSGETKPIHAAERISGISNKTNLNDPFIQHCPTNIVWNLHFKEEHNRQADSCLQMQQTSFTS